MLCTEYKLKNGTCMISRIEVTANPWSCFTVQKLKCTRVKNKWIITTRGSKPSANQILFLKNNNASKTVTMNCDWHMRAEASASHVLHEAQLKLFIKSITSVGYKYWSSIHRIFTSITYSIDTGLLILTNHEDFPGFLRFLRTFLHLWVLILWVLFAWK